MFGKEAVQVEPIKVVATSATPLDGQLRKLADCDGYNSIEWEGDLSADPIIIKHVKTGLVVQVL